MATRRHDGIFLRDTFNDNGIVPSEGNIVYRSPDIMPRKTQSADPKSEFSNWNKRYQTSLEFGQENYIYIRCQNLAREERTGIVNLYWAPSNLFLHPSIWTKNVLHTLEGHDTLLFPHMAPGAKEVGEVPFIITPQRAGHRHICLIGIVGDEENPRGVPLNQNIDEFSDWVRDHANVGWHNFNIEDRKPDESYSYVVFITNPEDHVVRFQISTHLQNCDVGTVIEHVITSSGDNLVQPTFRQTTQRNDRSLDYYIPLPKGTHQLDVKIIAPNGATLPSNLDILITASAPRQPSIGEVYVTLQPEN